MPKFDSILQNQRRLRAFTGLDTLTFSDFLPHFTLAMEHYLQHTTLDGYLRERDRAITYANSPLPNPLIACCSSCPISNTTPSSRCMANCSA